MTGGGAGGPRAAVAPGSLVVDEEYGGVTESTPHPGRHARVVLGD
ncbi:hypothetical protein [Streptomyces buecherae]